MLETPEGAALYLGTLERRALGGDAAGSRVSGSLKKELIHYRVWPTKAELRGEVFEYIEVFYIADDDTAVSGNSLRVTTRGITHSQNQMKVKAA